MKYLLQINTVNMTIPLKDEYTEDDAARLGGLFDQAYTDLYGAGAAYPEGRACDFILHDKRWRVSCTILPRIRRPLQARTLGRGIRAADRRISKAMDSWKRPCLIFAKLLPGNEVVGPAIIEADETTIVVPPGYNALLDGFKNIELVQTGDGPVR